jgi:hypothetical protein
MKNENSFTPLAKAYYAVLAAADEKEGRKSAVMIAPLPDELALVILPRGIHPLCWTLAGLSGDESLEAFILAMRARYHPDLTMNHIYPLLFEVNREMLHTAEDVGVPLIIAADGLLHWVINNYALYYRDSAWRIDAPGEDVALKTLAEAIEYTGKLRRAEKRRNRDKR